MIRLSEQQRHSFTLASDAEDILAKMGMDAGSALDIASKWCWRDSVLRVYVVEFADGYPVGFKRIGFTDLYDRSKEEFVEFMFDLSLTHKVLYVTKKGSVFVAESEDGQTNIDAKLIDAMLNAYR